MPLTLSFLDACSVERKDSHISLVSLNHPRAFGSSVSPTLVLLVGVYSASAGGTGVCSSIGRRPEAIG